MDKDRDRIARDRFRENHPSYWKEYGRKYREQNKDRIAGYYRAWYLKNKRNRSQKDSKRALIWEKKHPEIKSAINAVYYALRKGKIIKPLRCQVCDRERKLIAHHFNYDEPLKIVWICQSCHKVLHKKWPVKNNLNKKA